HKQDRGDLQELHAKRNRGEDADGKITGAKRDCEADQEDARGQRSHGLAGERVVENEPEDALLIGVGRWRAFIVNRPGKAPVQLVHLAFEHAAYLVEMALYQGSSTRSTSTYRPRLVSSSR